MGVWMLYDGGTMYYLPLTIDFCNSLEATRLFQVRDKILTYTL